MDRNGLQIGRSITEYLSEPKLKPNSIIVRNGVTDAVVSIIDLATWVLNIRRIEKSGI